MRNRRFLSNLAEAVEKAPIPSSIPSHGASNTMITLMGLAQYSCACSPLRLRQEPWSIRPRLRPVAALVRTASELARVLATNPFPDAAPNRAVVFFLDEPPMGDALERITGKNGEDVRLGQREIYVHDGDGMANSKLKIPDAKAGTDRNINTVFKFVAMVDEV
jgi:Protein of unknown function (DUF1697)